MRTVAFTLFASLSYTTRIDRNYLDILNTTIADMREYASTRRKYLRRDRKPIENEMFKATDIKRVQS